MGSQIGKRIRMIGMEGLVMLPAASSFVQLDDHIFLDAHPCWRCCHA